MVDGGDRVAAGSAAARGVDARRPAGRAAGQFVAAGRPAAASGRGWAAAGPRRRATGSWRRARSWRSRTRRPSGSRSPPCRNRSVSPGAADPVDPPVVGDAPPDPQVVAARRAAEPGWRTSRCRAPAACRRSATRPGPGTARGARDPRGEVVGGDVERSAGRPATASGVRRPHGRGEQHDQPAHRHGSHCRWAAEPPRLLRPQEWSRPTRLATVRLAATFLRCRKDRLPWLPCSSPEVRARWPAHRGAAAGGGPRRPGPEPDGRVPGWRRAT